MIFKILFNVVAFSMAGVFFYLSLKLVLIFVSLRNKNERWIGKGWNGRFTKKEILKLRELTDEKGKQDIDMALRYLGLPWKVLAIGVLLLFIVIWLNRVVNVE